MNPAVGVGSPNGSPKVNREQRERKAPRCVASRRPSTQRGSEPARRSRAAGRSDAPASLRCVAVVAISRSARLVVVGCAEGRNDSVDNRTLRARRLWRGCTSRKRGRGSPGRCHRPTLGAQHGQRSTYPRSGTSRSNGIRANLRATGHRATSPCPILSRITPPIHLISVVAS